MRRRATLRALGVELTVVLATNVLYGIIATRRRLDDLLAVLGELHPNDVGL